MVLPVSEKVAMVIVVLVTPREVAPLAVPGPQTSVNVPKLPAAGAFDDRAADDPGVDDVGGVDDLADVELERPHATRPVIASATTAALVVTEWGAR
jgi:hypothetical protein